MFGKQKTKRERNGSKGTVEGHRKTHARVRYRNWRRTKMNSMKGRQKQKTFNAPMLHRHKLQHISGLVAHGRSVPFNSCMHASDLPEQEKGELRKSPTPTSLIAGDWSSRWTIIVIGKLEEEEEEA